MRLTEVACNIVAEEGVDRVFGLMGDGNMTLITYLTSELDIPFHTSRHEAGGIGMADGYARATGNVGVCTVTQGPGLTNAMTALVTARKARSPLVLLLGDVAEVQRGWPQDIDHDAMLGAAGVPVIWANDPTTIHTDVRKAFAMARALSAPVAVNFPLDHQTREWEPWDVDVEREDTDDSAPEPRGASAEGIAAVAALLMGAHRPLIVAGRGAMRSGAGETLRRLGEHVGALMATTLPAKGLFRDDPYDIGIAGSLGTNQGISLINTADVVLTLGASLHDFTTLKGSLFSDRVTLIRCDVDVAPGANRRRADVDLEGDATAIAAQLLEAVTALGESREAFRTEAITTLLREFSVEQEFTDNSEPEAMDPRSVMVTLGDVLPHNRQIVTDVGHFFGFSSTFLATGAEARYFPVVDFGAVGSGIGVAIGASLARPDLTTVFFVGDGGLMMSLPDLDTVARLQPRMIIIVMNDGAYGSELQMLRQWNLPIVAATFDNPSFETLGETFGIPSMTVLDVAGLAAISDRFAACEGPLLVDCHITQNVLASWLAGAFER